MPVVAGIGTGGWGVAWAERDVLYDVIVTRVVHPDGTLGPITRASGPTSGLDREPTIAGLSDGYVVAWTEWLGGGTADPDLGVRARIFDAILATASGKPTKSEELGYGEDEFAPWHVNAWL